MGCFFNYSSFSKENHFKQNTDNSFVFHFFLKYLHFCSTFCQFKEVLQTFIIFFFLKTNYFHACPESLREICPHGDKGRGDLLPTHSWRRTFPSSQVVLIEVELAASASFTNTMYIQTHHTREERRPPAYRAQGPAGPCPRSQRRTLLPNRLLGTHTRFLKFPLAGHVSLRMDPAPQLGILQEFKPSRNISLSFITV